MNEEELANERETMRAYAKTGQNYGRPTYWYIDANGKSQRTDYFFSRSPEEQQRIIAAENAREDVFNARSKYLRDQEKNNSRDEIFMKQQRERTFLDKHKWSIAIAIVVILLIGMIIFARVWSAYHPAPGSSTNTFSNTPIAYNNGSIHAGYNRIS